MTSSKDKGIYHNWSKDVPILKTVIITGFIKSTIGTSFISIGVALIFNGAISNDINELFYLYGIISILIGFLIYFVGDIYLKKKQEEEIEIIQGNTENMIDTKTKKIKKQIQKIIEDEEDRKDKAVRRRLEQLEVGICTDISKDNPNIEEYCKSREIDYTVLVYPNDYPITEILDIGKQKAYAQGEEPTVDWLEKYVNALYLGGFINNKQRQLGMKILGDEQ